MSNTTQDNKQQEQDATIIARGITWKRVKELTKIVQERLNALLKEKKPINYSIVGDVIFEVTQDPGEIYCVTVATVRAITEKEMAQSNVARMLHELMSK